MNRISFVMILISVLLLFSLISLNPASLSGNAYAEADQENPITPQPSETPQRQQLPEIGDEFQKNIHYNDIVLIGQGRIISEDEVVNDVVIIGADLIVNGTVKGDAVCIGGNLTVGPMAVINGDVANIGGQLTIDPLAKTNGELVNIGGVFPFSLFKGKKGEPKVFDKRFVTFFKILPLTIDSIFFIFILFFGLFMTAFMQRQFDHIEEYLTNEFPRCALLGIACMIGLPILIFFLIIMMVGILAVPFLVLAIIVSCMMGVVVFGRVLGRKLIANSPIMLQILIGLLLLYSLLLAGDIILLLSSGSVYSIIGHILRLIGIIILICVNFIGLGAVVYSVWGTRDITNIRGDKPNNFSSMSGGANIATA
jgi:hypothetical protein